MSSILKKILQEKGLSANKLAFKSEISPSDLSQAINNKKPFFPAWRKRVSKALGMSESEVFPEYNRNVV